MSDLTIKSRNSNILAACIVGGCLVLSAIINSLGLAVVGESKSLLPGAKVTVTPPFTQEQVEEQFCKQLLAAPTLQTYKVNGKTYILKDIDVTRVTYNAEKDYFTVSFHWVWKEGKAPESWNNSSNLYNDGYGHYWGPAVLSPILNGTGQNAEVTIR